MSSKLDGSEASSHTLPPPSSRPWSHFMVAVTEPPLAPSSPRSRPRAMRLRAQIRKVLQFVPSRSTPFSTRVTRCPTVARDTQEILKASCGCASGREHPDRGARARGGQTTPAPAPTSSVPADVLTSAPTREQPEGCLTCRLSCDRETTPCEDRQKASLRFLQANEDSLQRMQARQVWSRTGGLSRFFRTMLHEPVRRIEDRLLLLVRPHAPSQRSFRFIQPGHCQRYLVYGGSVAAR